MPGSLGLMKPVIYFSATVTKKRDHLRGLYHKLCTKKGIKYP